MAPPLPFDIIFYTRLSNYLSHFLIVSGWCLPNHASVLIDNAHGGPLHFHGRYRQYFLFYSFWLSNFEFPQSKHLKEPPAGHNFTLIRASSSKRSIFFLPAPTKECRMPLTKRCHGRLRILVRSRKREKIKKKKKKGKKENVDGKAKRGLNLLDLGIVL